jgi:hypothetical protein
LGSSKLTVDFHRFLRRLQRRLALPQVGEPGTQVVETRGQVGQEGLGLGSSKLTVEFHRFLRRLQRRLALSQRGEYQTKLIQAFS